MAALRATTASVRTGGRRKAFDDEESLPLERLACLRESAYRALSQSLLAPTRETSKAVASHLGEWISDPSASEEFAFSTQLFRLHSVWATMDEQTLVRLQSRYVALFVTATGGVPCPPYESVYVATSPGDEGRVIAAIELDYATVGLYGSRGQKHSPDHISMELEFMAILCRREADAWESKVPKRAVRLLKKEQGFLHQHLGSWLPTFTHNVNAEDAGGIYSKISAAALAFVIHDTDLGEELAVAYGVGEGPS